MRLHGISRDVFDRYTSRKPSWRYEVIAPGFKYNLTDTAAALGRVQLRRAVEMAAARERIANRYREGFAGLPLELPASGREAGGHSWHVFAVRLEESAPVDRDGFVDALAGAGIGTSVHFIPLHLHPYWRQSLGIAEEDMPNATREFRRVVSLPIYSAMTEAQVDRVIEVVREVMAA